MSHYPIMRHIRKSSTSASCPFCFPIEWAKMKSAETPFSESRHHISYAGNIGTKLLLIPFYPVFKVYTLEIFKMPGVVGHANEIIDNSSTAY